MGSDLIGLQVVDGGPSPQGVSEATNLLLPNRTTANRLDHFPEEVYDVSAESHLVRFLKAMIGDSGAGQLRKRLISARLQQSIQGVHFYDLDKFYGALFGVRRNLSETLSVDPYTGLATSDVWAEQQAKDASYRSRIVQFARGLTFGPTPTGIELVAEALLSVDVDVYESFTQADASYQTYAELEVKYGGAATSLADMEGVSYAELEGASLGRVSGNERREFVIRPKRPITASEAYELGRVLRQIKPADARFVIDQAGSQPLGQVPIKGLLADSNYWEIVPRVSTGVLPGSPYTLTSSVPVEQPRPPFTGYMGEAWSYTAEVIGVAASSLNPLTLAPTAAIAERVVMPDGSILDYPAYQALIPKRFLLAGRSTSDGVLVAHPFWASSPQTSPDLAPLFTDRINLDALNSLLAHSPIDSFPQNPVERHWATPMRFKDDATVEVIEVSLAQVRRINYVALEVAHYPHQVQVQAFVGDAWVTLGTETINDSFPAYLPPGASTLGHPQHSASGHWSRLSFRLSAAVQAASVRVRLTRTPGLAPKSDLTTEVAYSLGMRSLDVGYRVTSLSDVPAEAMPGTVAIGATVDPVGSRMEFYLRQQNAINMLDPGVHSWKSEPQPVNYAVVNLYLDLRSATGDSQVINRFFLDPTYTGAHLSIYFTEAVGTPSAAWYADQVWRPIARDYRVQRGILRIPPTAARHFKFEFTSLTPEPCESMLSLTSTVRLFPQSLIDAISAGSISTEALPSGLRTAIEIGDDRRYADAVQALRDEAVDSRDYLDTSALYINDPASQARARERAWAFGFTPWHQGTSAPAFTAASKHVYDTVEMKHTTQVGFFIGFNDIQAYRSDPSADDDTLVYDEHFYDYRDLNPGFTWTFNPGALSTVLGSTSVATSRVYASKHNVASVAFATQQTAPVQVIPDDDFRDPALSSIDWNNNPDGWHRYGDAVTVYSPANHSARVVRYSQPLLRTTVRTGGIVQRPFQEVFSYRPLLVADATQSAASYGGIETPLLGVSPLGTAYAAVRMTFVTTPTSPVRVQVVDGTTSAVLMDYALTGNAGETIERYFPVTLTGAISVRVRLFQTGVSSDRWEVDRLSLFDVGIRWEFSVNGGETWVPVEGVRNNAQGVVTFPDPGNQLTWRVTGMRSRMSLSALRMRVNYLGVQNARNDGLQRGPNVSSFDAAVPITEDPLFTTWAQPVPRDWFLAYRQFPSLVSVAGPTVTEFARFYGRPTTEVVPTPTDATVRVLSAVRSLIQTARGLVWIGGFGDGAFGDGAFGGTTGEGPTAYDTAVRQVSFFRSTGEVVPAPTDSAVALKLMANPTGLVNVPVHPV